MELDATAGEAAEVVERGGNRVSAGANGGRHIRPLRLEGFATEPSQLTVATALRQLRCVASPSLFRFNVEGAAQDGSNWIDRYDVMIMISHSGHLAHKPPIRLCQSIPEQT